jgi:hypothetical protein
LGCASVGTPLSLLLLLLPALPALPALALTTSLAPLTPLPAVSDEMLLLLPLWRIRSSSEGRALRAGRIPSCMHSALLEAYASQLTLWLLEVG